MDTELLSIFSERESSKIRAELQNEIHAVRLELEKQRSENAELLLKADSKIANAKSEITEVAIDKTLNVLAHVRNWIIVVGIIFSVGAFLGWKGFDSYMKTYFKEKVETWLRFEDSESGSKKTLEQIRTQAILDAYTIRLARSYSSPFGVNAVKLTSLEIERLVEIIVDPSTSYGDFADALRLVTKSRGIFTLLSPEDNVGKRLVGILGDSSYDGHKKGLILEYMQKDESLFPFAKEILSESKNTEYVRMSAFHNVVNFDAAYALKFAEENMNSFLELRPKSELAEYIVKTNPNSQLVRDFLDTLIINRPEGWELNYLGIILSLIENESRKTTNDLPNIISKLISNGLQLRVTDSSFGPRYIVLELNGVSIPLKDPKSFFSNDSMINQVMLSKELNTQWLESIVDFYQVVDNSYYITTLLVSPSQSSKFILDNFSELTNDKVLGPIWLRTNESSVGKELTIIWRDKVGIVHENQLLDVINADKNSYKISFDPNVVERISIRSSNYYMHSW